MNGKRYLGALALTTILGVPCIAHASCGSDITLKQAETLVSAAGKAEAGAPAVLTGLMGDVPDPRSFFLTGGQDAVSNLQRSASVTSRAESVKNLVEIRDGMKDPKSRKGLEEHINYTLFSLKGSTDYIARSTSEMRRFAKKSATLAFMDEVEKSNRAIATFLADCHS